jgi:hypothetical protein
MSAGTTQFYSNYDLLPTVLINEEDSSPITPTPIMYTNINMTSTANNGYYSNSIRWWRVTGGAGVITETGVCPI